MPPASPIGPNPTPAARQPSVADQRRQARWERQQARCAEVLRFRAEGWPIRAIASHLGMHRRDVRRLLCTGKPVPRSQPKRRGCQLDQHADYLDRRWAEGCHNAAQLWRELRQQGFSGSATRVRQWVRQRHRPESGKTAMCGRAARPAPSPRQIAWVLLDGPRVVDDRTQSLIRQFRQRVPEVDRAAHLAVEFTRLLRDKREQELKAGCSRRKRAAWPHLRRVCAGTRQPCKGRSARHGARGRWKAKSTG